MQTKHILFIAPTRIGDAVLAASILQHIALTEPQARVTIATSPLAAPLYENYPNLERTITITKRTYNRHWLKLWRQTFGQRWHTVWDTRNSILSFILRARRVYRFTSPKDGAPKVRQYANVFKTGPLPPPILWPRAEDIAAAEKLLPADSRYLIFAPIANWPPKEWPLDYFITLARNLLDRTGYRPILICAPNERERALPMLDALAQYRPIDLTNGTTHLLTVYAIMQRAHGFVGNDSGLMHMASAAGTPTVGLFGPTPNIGDEAPHVRFLYAPEKDLRELAPVTVAQTLEELLGTIAHAER